MLLSLELRFKLNEPSESTECRSGLNEFHTVGTDTEKARDANVEATAAVLKIGR